MSSWTPYRVSYILDRRQTSAAKVPYLDGWMRHGGGEALRRTTPLPFISRGAGVQHEDMSAFGQIVFELADEPFTDVNHDDALVEGGVIIADARRRSAGTARDG
jgi:hypothetical protein